MPACPYRSWAANDSDCSSNRRQDTVGAKIMEEKLKNLIAARDNLDQRLIDPMYTSPAAKHQPPPPSSLRTYPRAASSQQRAT